MSTNNKNNSLTQVQLDQKVQNGIDKHFASITALTIANTLYSPAQLKQVFQDEVDAQKLVDDARSQLKQRLSDLKTKRARRQVAQRGLKRYVLGMWGEDAPSNVEDFGFTVPKPNTNKSAQVKAQAVATAKATRELRHTMGSKQKEKVRAPTVELQAVTASQAPTPSQPGASTVPTPPVLTPAAPSGNGSAGPAKPTA